MTEVLPPKFNFNGINFNPAFWSSSSQGLTQAQANQLYLQRTGVPTSIASLTTFQNNVAVNDILVTNKNDLSNVKFVSGSTTLSFGDPEYICVNNSVSYTITLPSPVTNNIGTKFSFFFTSTVSTTTAITIQTYVNTQYIYNGSSTVNSIILNNSSTGSKYYYYELVCIKGSTGTCWSIISYSTDLSNVPFLNSNNTWTGTTNDFTGSSLSATTQITTDSSTKVATTAFVKNQAYTTLTDVQSNNNAFTGTCTATTQTTTDNSTKLATTAFVKNQNYGIVYVNNDANDNSFLLGSGNSTLTGYNNFSAGANALNYLTTGYLNVGIGKNALFSCQDGTENFGMGSNSLYSLTSGSFNTAIGVFTGSNLTTGISNTFIGRYCGGALTTQSNNTFVGYFCGVRSFGEGNTVYGAYSLGNNCYGNSNTIIGFSSGTIQNLTGSNNTIIGSSANLGSTTISNSCAIGTGAIATSSNGIYLGRISEVTYAVGGLTIPTSTTLTLSGSIYANSSTITPTSLSYISSLSSDVQTQINSILNGTSAFTGTVGFNNASFSGTLNSVSTTIFGYISTLSSNAQTQINSILNGTSAFTGTVGLTNATFSGTLNSVSTTIFGYISNLSSDAQTQFNNITSGTTNIQQKTQYIHSAYTQLTGTTTPQSIATAPYYENYNIAVTGAITINLPSASSSLNGVVLNFRRTNTSAVAITSNIGYYPLTSNSVTTTALLTASSTTQAGNNIRLVCLLQSGTTYAWYQV